MQRSDLLEAYESRGLRIRVAHEPEHAALTAELAAEPLRHLRLGELASVGSFLVGLLIPAGDLENACCLRHRSTSVGVQAKCYGGHRLEMIYSTGASLNFNAPYGV